MEEDNTNKQKTNKENAWKGYRKASKYSPSDGWWMVSGEIIKKKDGWKLKKKCKLSFEEYASLQGK